MRVSAEALELPSLTARSLARSRLALRSESSWDAASLARSDRASLFSREEIWARWSVVVVLAEVSLLFRLEISSSRDSIAEDLEASWEVRSSLETMGLVTDCDCLRLEAS